MLYLGTEYFLVSKPTYWQQFSVTALGSQASVRIELQSSEDEAQSDVIKWDGRMYAVNDVIELTLQEYETVQFQTNSGNFIS